MIIVTGGAGFIGSNIIKALNDAGEDAILLVEDFEDGRKMFNLSDCRIADYADRDRWLHRMRSGEDVLGDARAVLHQGACSTTTEWNGRYMMESNFEFSRLLLDQCLARRIPFIYASSASVYGAGREFRVSPACEHPINMYAFSKLCFDNYVRRQLPQAESQVVGLRYFNVYGPREQHKGGMASVAWHFHRQLLEGDEIRLFEGSDGYADGEQRRDFVYVGDIVRLNLWFLARPSVSGLFNAGTGRSQTFNDVARAVIDWHGRGQIRYVPFPEELKGSYQSFTEADLSALREAGYNGEFLNVQQGVKRYLDLL